MIRDKASELSTAQAVASGTVVSTNYLDTQIPGGDAAVGSETRLAVTVDETFGDGTSVAVQIFTDSDSAFGTETKVYESAAIPVATLKKGYTLGIKLPFGLKRYVRLKYVVVGTNSAGKVTAGIVKEVDNWKVPAVGVKY